MITHTKSVGYFWNIHIAQVQIKIYFGSSCLQVYDFQVQQRAVVEITITAVCRNLLKPILKHSRRTFGDQTLQRWVRGYQYSVSYEPQQQAST